MHKEKLLTSPFMKKMNTPTLQEDFPFSQFLFKAVIAVVFVTLLSVVVLIIVYLYKNKGTYRTYEQAPPDPEGSVQMEDLPCKGEKEEYFI
uniref:Small cell adhesion glycoprotein n=1 Tax=Podarcis muralis TaxID=64176 RepID=A0A670KGK0_PODMU